MAREQALQFIQFANKDQRVQSKLQAVKDGGVGLVKVGKEYGFDFTTEEMKSIVEAQQIPESGELSDEALESVSGGLVVIAIIAILIGQLLPVVQASPKTK